MRLFRAVCVIAITTSCDLAFPLYEATDGAPDATELDASDAASDATSENDAGIPSCGTDSGVDGNDLLLNPGFELLLGTGCDSWTTGSLSPTLWDGGHSGLHSCQVCVSAGAGFVLAISQHVNQSFPAGTPFVVSGYAKPSPGYASAKVRFQGVVTELDGGQLYASANVNVDAGWTFTGLSSSPCADGTVKGIQYNVLVEALDSGTSCALVDDLSLQAQ